MSGFRSACRQRGPLSEKTAEVTGKVVDITFEPGTMVKAGETVVSPGVFKLRNGQTVIVDSRLAPEFKLNPKPEDH